MCRRETPVLKKTKDDGRTSLHDLFCEVTHECKEWLIVFSLKPPHTLSDWTRPDSTLRSQRWLTWLAWRCAFDYDHNLVSFFEVVFCLPQSSQLNMSDVCNEKSAMEVLYSVPQSMTTTARWLNQSPGEIICMWPKPGNCTPSVCVPQARSEDFAKGGANL